MHSLHSFRGRLLPIILGKNFELNSGGGGSECSSPHNLNWRVSGHNHPHTGSLNKGELQGFDRGKDRAARAKTRTQTYVSLLANIWRGNGWSIRPCLARRPFARGLPRSHQP